jgi:hypothetical protein
MLTAMAVRTWAIPCPRQRPAHHNLTTASDHGPICRDAPSGRHTLDNVTTPLGVFRGLHAARTPSGPTLLPVTADRQQRAIDITGASIVMIPVLVLTCRAMQG